MSVGFRKSLFGYNTDDVIEYVKNLHGSFSEKENSFKAQISALEEKINALSSQQTLLEREKDELNLKLLEYENKKAEMERLSENIGKLYLVAQTNAKTIMATAEENSKITNDEINRNVSAIEETHNALEALKQSINETSANFTKEVESLISSLADTKAKISADNIKSDNSSEEFASLLEAVSR